MPFLPVDQFRTPPYRNGGRIASSGGNPGGIGVRAGRPSRSLSPLTECFRPCSCRPRMDADCMGLSTQAAFCNSLRPKDSQPRGFRTPRAA